MNRPRVSLSSLRRQIDGVDDRIHDLFMNRAEIVEKIGQAKSRGGRVAIFRPAREAEILRRLVKRHKGAMPISAVVRVWREMVAAFLAIQGPFSVAVQAPEKSVGYWDLARDHYGSCTRMSLHGPANRVIQRVVDRTATVGVLVAPQDDDRDPWWRHLPMIGEHMPRVVARLPFVDNSNGRFENLSALAIAQVDQEKTGDDASLIVVDASAEYSRAKLSERIIGSGLPANIIAVWQDKREPGSRLHLVEIADFVGDNDVRLARFEEKMGEHCKRVVRLGGYAVPLGQTDAK